MSMNCGHQGAYCSSPQVLHEHGEAWWMMSTGKNCKSVHQSTHLLSYKQSHLVAYWEDLGKGNNVFCL
jgi:hypothetical protein